MLENLSGILGWSAGIDVSVGTRVGDWLRLNREVMSGRDITLQITEADGC